MAAPVDEEMPICVESDADSVMKGVRESRSSIGAVNSDHLRRSFWGDSMSDSVEFLIPSEGEALIGEFRR